MWYLSSYLAWKKENNEKKKEEKKFLTSILAYFSSYQTKNRNDLFFSFLQTSSILSFFLKTKHTTKVFCEHSLIFLDFPWIFYKYFFGLSNFFGHLLDFSKPKMLPIFLLHRHVRQDILIIKSMQKEVWRFQIKKWSTCENEVDSLGKKSRVKLGSAASNTVQKVDIGKDQASI